MAKSQTRLHLFITFRKQDNITSPRRDNKAIPLNNSRVNSMDIKATILVGQFYLYHCINIVSIVFLQERVKKQTLIYNIMITKILLYYLPLYHVLTKTIKTYSQSSNLLLFNYLLLLKQNFKQNYTYSKTNFIQLTNKQLLGLDLTSDNASFIFKEQFNILY